MKIAIVSPYITSKFESEKFYNIQSFSISSELVKHDIAVDIYTGRKEGDPAERVIPVSEKHFFKVQYLPVLFEIAQQPVLRSLISRLKKGNYDLIQTSEDFQFTTLQIASLNKSLKSPLVIFQGMYAYPSTKPWNILYPLYDKTLGRFILHSTSLVVAKTTKAEKFMRNKGYSNVVTIPIGVDDELFYPREREIFRGKVGIREEDPLIIYVGILEDRRDPLSLIDAMSLVIKNIPNANLLIIGDGPLKGEVLERIKEKNLESNIKILSKIPNAEMPYVYSSADLFVLLSQFEIFGMVILESMACATPVISTHTAGALDLINHGKNGMLIPFKNPEKTGEVIIGLLENRDLLAEMGKNARKTILDRYAWSNLGERYASVYKKLILEKSDNK